jgi:hypothetical protein
MALEQRVDQGGTIQGLVTVPRIVSSGSYLGQTGGTTVLSFTPPPVAGVYRVACIVDVVSWTTPASFTIVVAFHNGTGASKSVTMLTVEDDGTTSALIDEVTGFQAMPFIFQIDNSGTAITVTTTGTFTGTPVFNIAITLEQLI